MYVSYRPLQGNFRCQVHRGDIHCSAPNKTDLRVEFTFPGNVRKIELCSAHHAQLRPALMRALLESEI